MTINQILTKIIQIQTQTINRINGLNIDYKLPSSVVQLNQNGKIPNQLIDMTFNGNNIDLSNYYTKSEIDNKNYLVNYIQIDPIFTANSGKFALNKNIPTKISQLINDLNYLTGYTQTDPIFTANSGKFALASTLEDLSGKFNEVQISGADLTNYYTKQEIDNKNYLTDYNQTDPIFTANSSKFALISNTYTKTEINNMMTANSFQHWLGTEEQYNSITNKNSNTIYFIRED